MCRGIYCVADYSSCEGFCPSKLGTILPVSLPQPRRRPQREPYHSLFAPHPRKTPRIRKKPPHKRWPRLVGVLDSVRSAFGNRIPCGWTLTDTHKPALPYESAQQIRGGALRQAGKVLRLRPAYRTMLQDIVDNRLLTSLFAGLCTMRLHRNGTSSRRLTTRRTLVGRCRRSRNVISPRQHKSK